jgi:hypothetical protein
MGLLDMFKQLFKRTMLEEWEIPLLTNVIAQMGPQYALLKEQLDEGIVWHVSLTDELIENSVYLGAHPEIAVKYQDLVGRIFRFTGIGVYSKGSLERGELDIYVGCGMVNAYAISPKGFVPDPANIDMSRAKVEYLDQPDDEVKAIFTAEELGVMNWEDVYEVVLDQGVFYHLRDIGEGRFLATDDDKHVYEISSEPFSVKIVEGSIVENLMVK